MTQLLYTFSIVTTQSEIAGVYTVTVTVSDGAQQVSQAFVVTIQNALPVFNVPLAN